YGEDHGVLGEHDRIDPGHDDADAEHEQDEPRQREARRAGRVPVASPLPAAELREVVRAGEDGVDRSPANREEDADEREQQADLPERLLRTERDRPEVLRLDAVSEEERAADEHER